MDLNALKNSKEYKDADEKVSKWKDRIINGDKGEALKVGSEKREFFDKMKATMPQLYLSFEMDDKDLSEMIFKKMTGKDIIIN